MRKTITKYFIFFVLACLPLGVSATEQAVKQAHKPPILTTTAIIEIHKSFDL